MIEVLHAILLGIAQGLGEFLPISSSAHLILVPWLFGWDDPGLTFDVALHMGTLLAVVGYFWRDWLALLAHAHQPRSEQGRLFWLLVLASVPGALAGVLLESAAEGVFRQNILLIACTLATMGLVLWAVDRWRPQERTLSSLGVGDALAIGVAQALAIVPGVSRSGITMALARWRGFDRATAARFSFLMSTPIIAGAGLWSARHLSAATLSLPTLAGVVAAALTGALVIAGLLRYLRRHDFALFAGYRVLVALLIVGVVGVGARPSLALLLTML